MNLDQYNIYSTLSLNKDTSESDLLQILEQAKHFEEIDEISDAKKYLREVWGIKDVIRNYPLCDNCLLNVIESPKTFCVNLVHEKENVTYYYQK